jgi:two-component system, OmpR family, alkaline phosphatase synthesis response regulator PhoP
MAALPFSRHPSGAPIASKRAVDSESAELSMAQRILICDDEVHISLAVSLKMRNAGFEVETARNGNEGWEKVQKQAPDLVISDLTMPVVDGLELCRRIRTLPEHQETPIFLLTARGLELDARVISEHFGINKIILKPFSPRDLLRDVQAALSEKKLAAAATA